jgi:predicted Zn-ribbon and HTH transcriptional regulator
MNSEAMVTEADGIYEAFRMLNHATITNNAPAPLVYDLTGNLKAATWGYRQLCEQLGRGVVGSLTEYEVYDNSDRTPEESAELCRAHLLRAATLLEQVGREIEAAQSAVNQQGYTDRKSDQAAAALEKCPQCGSTDVTEWDMNDKLGVECRVCSTTWTPKAGR